MYPRPYEEWLQYDFDLLNVCDGLLRLSSKYEPWNYIQSESPGANREIEYIQKLNKPVFYNKPDSYNWGKYVWNRNT